MAVVIRSDRFYFCLVFGVELEFLLQKEAGGQGQGQGQGVQPGAIPSIIQVCLAEVEARGLSEQGICMCRSGSWIEMAKCPVYRSDCRRCFGNQCSQGCIQSR